MACFLSVKCSGRGAAQGCGTGGQGDDVVVGQVGDLDEAGGAAFGDQVGQSGVLGGQAGGAVALAGPAVAEDDVAAAGGGAAEGGAVAEQVAQALGDDVHAGPLGGGDDRHGGRAAAGDQVAQQGDEFFLLLFGAQHGGVQGDLVEDRGDDGDVVAGLDLAALPGAQPGIPVVHDALQPLEGGDGVVEVGADELIGDGVPQAELDLLAVEQHQAGAG